MILALFYIFVSPSDFIGHHGAPQNISPKIELYHEFSKHVLALEALFKADIGKTG